MRGSAPSPRSASRTGRVAERASALRPPNFLQLRQADDTVEGRSDDRSLDHADDFSACARLSAAARFTDLATGRSRHKAGRLPGTPRTSKEACSWPRQRPAARDPRPRVQIAGRRRPRRAVTARVRRASGPRRAGPRQAALAAAAAASVRRVAAAAAAAAASVRRVSAVRAEVSRHRRSRVPALRRSRVPAGRLAAMAATSRS